jgi:ABC-type glutathione transport system ATPase component
VTSALIFRNLMQELARSGKTILYSSHVLEAVEKVCSRVMIIYYGRLIADNSVGCGRSWPHPHWNRCSPNWCSRPTPQLWRAK